MCAKRQTLPSATSGASTAWSRGPPTATSTSAELRAQPLDEERGVAGDERQVEDGDRSGRATSSSASTCGVRASTTTPRVATAPAITSRSVASSLRATKVLEPVPAGARVAVIGGSGSGSASGAGNDTGIGSVMDLVAANGLGNRSYREYHDSARPEATPRGRLHGDSVKCGRVSLRECDARHPAPCWRRKRSGGTPAWRRKKREK
ncbi:MAG: hypothetical protein U1F30_16110 [Steroidobacteraceae bacterium]